MNDAQRLAAQAAPFANAPRPEQDRRDRSEPLSRSHFGFEDKTQLSETQALSESE